MGVIKWLLQLVYIKNPSIHKGQGVNVMAIVPFVCHFCSYVVTSSTSHQTRTSRQCPSGITYRIQPDTPKCVEYTITLNSLFIQSFFLSPTKSTHNAISTHNGFQLSTTVFNQPQPLLQPLPRPLPNRQPSLLH